MPTRFPDQLMSRHSRRKKEHQEKDARLTGDRPAQTPEQDRFGWSDTFIPVLARVTREWPAQVGLTFGLYGRWGSGKTSVLNLLEEYLKRDEHRDRYPWTYIVRFNPWFYDDPRALTVSFFATLGETLEKEGAGKVWAEAGNIFKTMGRFLAVASRAVSVAGVNIDVEGIQKAADVATGAGELTELFEKGEKELQERRKKLEKKLEALGRDKGRVMVLVDDVDRLDSDELISLLRLLRTVAELPAVTLIVAADEHRVREVLEAAGSRGYGRAYLEKIVQAHMHVPLTEPERLEELLREGIVETLRNANASVPPSLLRKRRRNAPDLGTLRLLRELISTPRHLVRYLNGLRLLSLSRPAWDLDSMDAVHLAAVQVFFPDVYDRIRSSKSFLTGVSSSREVLREDEELVREERRRQWNWIITGSHSTEPGTEFELLASMLERMFGNIIERQPRFRGDATEARKIQSPEIFDSYFAYVTEPLWMTRNEVHALVEELISHAGAGNAPALASRLRDAVTPLTDEAKERLWHDLEVQLQELDLPTLTSLGNAIGDLHASLKEALWNSLWLAWLAALRGYPPQSGDGENPLQIAEEQAAKVIRDSASTPRALWILRNTAEILHGNPFASPVLNSAWLDNWAQHLDSTMPDLLGTLSLEDIAELAVTAAWLQLHPDKMMGNTLASREALVRWLRSEPQLVVAVIEYMTDGRPLRALQSRAAKTVQDLAELVGGADVAAELLRSARQAGVEDPHGNVSAALEHLASASSLP